VAGSVDLLHRPQAPLPGLGLAFQRRRIEPPMLLGEVKRDRQRFPQDKAIVFDRRQAAVGIDGEIVRLARPGGADLDRNVLVIEPELLGDPERAKGAGARDAVNAQFGHRYSAWRRCGSRRLLSGKAALKKRRRGDGRAFHALKAAASTLAIPICLERSSPASVRSSPKVLDKPVFPTAVNRNARLSRSRTSQPRSRQRRQICAPTRPAT